VYKPLAVAAPAGDAAARAGGTAGTEPNRIDPALLPAAA
jgi:hypothetical protein